ncbi:hypothetical protein ANN_02101 [Periplaneta americana]|uniref:Uncharacterized protein n=1 Tax=Periplaneta americana TaxID=6978 RepID=A0ABQ8TVB1_PERAM|nr:hypothetical protein ANN_02101 [Periplaneta americana]
MQLSKYVRSVNFSRGGCRQEEEVSSEPEAYFLSEEAELYPEIHSTGPNEPLSLCSRVSGIGWALESTLGVINNKTCCVDPHTGSLTSRYEQQNLRQSVEMVLMLRQCCCGCSLKTGSSIISVTDATIGLLSLVLAVAGPEFAKDLHGMYEVVLAGGVTGAVLLAVSVLLFFGARSVSTATPCCSLQCKYGHVLLLPAVVSMTTCCCSLQCKYGHALLLAAVVSTATPCCSLQCKYGHVLLLPAVVSTATPCCSLATCCCSCSVSMATCLPCSGQLRYLLPWLMYGCLYLVLSCVQHLLFSISSFNSGDTAVGVGFIVALVVHGCKLGRAELFKSLQVYSLLVVYSYFRELKGEAPTMP